MSSHHYKEDTEQPQDSQYLLLSLWVPGWRPSPSWGQHHQVLSWCYGKAIIQNASPQRKIRSSPRYLGFMWTHVCSHIRSFQWAHHCLRDIRLFLVWGLSEASNAPCTGIYIPVYALDRCTTAKGRKHSRGCGKLGRQRQVDCSEFKVNFIYILSSRAGQAYRESLSQKTMRQPKPQVPKRLLIGKLGI